jgi:hypothetical protein
MTAALATDLATSVRRFAPVDLADLAGEADLQVRVDRKYLLSADAAGDLLAALDVDAAMVLEINGSRRFGYESHYFDTPALTSYRSTAQRRRRRFKVRTRRYLEAGDTYLEVKTRGPRGATVKHRLAYGADPMGILDPTGRAFVATVLGAEAVPAVPVEGLAPVLTTRYHRSTLLLPTEPGTPAARVTVDTGLSWSQLSGGGRCAAGAEELTLRRVAIVETKSPRAASVVDRLLWSRGHRPVAISKFGTGMAALHPYLPDNRWHRLLGRLDPAVSTTRFDTHTKTEEQSCAAPS